MSKKLKIIIPSVAVVAAVIAAVVLTIVRFPVGDTQEKYLERVNSCKELENTIEEAIPQTKIHDIVLDHFMSELPEGKTAKKAIIIGYDGCRLDMAVDGISGVTKGGIGEILADGGKAYVSYCGGVPYPEKNTQKTSTAPGWCSQLTGVWADVHGITKNGVSKSNDHLTLFTTLIEDKLIDSSAFNVSWNGHFVKDNSTYILEKQYDEEKGYDVKYNYSEDDEGTLNKTLEQVNKADCPDFIFSIFEYCDHAGHSKGFGPFKKSYTEAFDDAEASSKEIIEAIKSRDTYDTEDWLIIITADHGGRGLQHGFASMQERYTFTVYNK